MGYPIPSIKAIYSRDEMAKFSPVEGLAAVMGTPHQFLYLTEDTQASIEGYALHTFKNLYVPLTSGKHTCSPKDQFKALEDFLSGPLYKKPASLIVINAFPFFFSGTEASSGELFLWHLACTLANYRIKTRDNQVDFHYLGSIEPEQHKWVEPKLKTVFAWGPITDDYAGYMYVHALKFLSTYSSYTRILLLSVSDLFSTFSRLRIDYDYPDYIVQLGPEAGKEIKEKPPKWAKKRVIKKMDTI